MVYVATAWQINPNAISGVEVEVETFTDWGSAETFINRAKASGWSGRVDVKNVLPNYAGNTIAQCRDFSVR
jgi:hypothetical protein